jgi:hypothetical protein
MYNPSRTREEAVAPEEKKKKDLRKTGYAFELLQQPEAKKNVY